MIGHFVKRDLRDFLFWWTALAAVTLLVGASAGWLVGSSARVFLWMAYFVFAFATGPQLLGSTWRTQHQWSRHYLLALPLSHWRLFAIQHIRILIFWLPLVVLAVVESALPGLEWKRFDTIDWVLYYFGLPASISLLIEMQIWTTLDMERIATYLPKNKRLWAGVRCMGLMYVVMGGLASAWFDLLLPVGALRAQHFGLFSVFPPVSWPGASFIIFPVAFLAAALWARHNARSWCVTL